MSFRDKLGRLNGVGLTAMRPVAEVSVPWSHNSQSQQSLREVLKSPEETPLGPLHVSEKRHHGHFLQGSVRLAQALKTSAETISLLTGDAALREVDPRNMLLLDTETTGLHGGTGTLPFLVGLAWFEGEELCVRQGFLRRPGEEKPLLNWVAEKLSTCSFLVTYNGKTFDWPLLKSRFVLNRMPVPEAKPHWDLLHVCRRIFKPRLAGTRLKLLESAVLSHDRGDDIDGALIPQTYFDFLRDGDTSRLEVVLEHNIQDLVTLAALAADVARRADKVTQEDNPHDTLSMAQLLLKAGRIEKAVGFAEQALEKTSETPVVAQALALLAGVTWRAGRHAEAIEKLETLAALSGAPASLKMQAHLSLAKWWEHRLKQPDKALKHARLAHAAEDATSHARRVSRLHGKLKRNSEEKAPPVASASSPSLFGFHQNGAEETVRSVLVRKQS